MSSRASTTLLVVTRIGCFGGAASVVLLSAGGVDALEADCLLGQVPSRCPIRWAGLGGCCGLSPCRG